MGRDVMVGELVEVFEGASSVVVAAHLRPDGDAIGSMLGLGLILEGMGKVVSYVHTDGVPGNLAFLDEGRRVKGVEEVGEGELFVALDTANAERLADGGVGAAMAGAVRVTIDHHVTNERYGDLVWVDAGSPATAQMVWELAQAGGWTIPLEAAVALYVGVSTDTGSFQYANTTGRTHEMAAALLGIGVDVAEVNRLTYQNFPARRVELLKGLLGTMERSGDGRVAWWSLTEAMKKGVG
ncbi:MAG: DHH family phosphoesterase, partial [Verrucomicrobiota bacterium]